MEHYELEGSPLSAYDRGTLYHILAHPYMRGSLSERVWIKPAEVTQQDLAIAERISNVFYSATNYENHMIRAEERPNSGIWEMTKHAFHGELYKLLANRDLPGIANYMCNAMREPVTHGLGTGKQVFDAMANIGDGRRANVILIADRLASLAEACRAIPYENPEQGRYGDNVGLGVTKLVQLIQAAIGVEITRPAVMGNFGVEVAGQIVDLRVPDDAYTMYRVTSLLETFKRSKVCEIGAGLGGNAVQAFRHKLKSYTIVDLPLTNLIQAWFIISIIGHENVRLFGEPYGGQFVSILPYWEFYNKINVYDFVVNRDSLPEMPELHVKNYIDEIARRKCAFLSINQESKGFTDSSTVLQLAVHEFVEANGAMQAIYRSPYWTRKGYVEEFFLPRA